MPIMLQADDAESMTAPNGEAALDKHTRPLALCGPRTQSPSSQHHAESDGLSDESWARQLRHYFVLSDSGKPIYTRHGNADNLAALFGIIQALLSLVAVDGGNELRSVHAGDHHFSFLTRPPLVLVAVSAANEPDTHLAVQLHYLHRLVLSVLTRRQIDGLFQQRSGFDLRRLLGGTERLFNGLVDRMAHDQSFYLDAVWALPLAPRARRNLGKTLLANKSSHLLFAVLLADWQFVAVMARKGYSLSTPDLLIIASTVAATQSLHTQEEFWTPICLPEFNDTGFLQMYTSRLDEDGHVCLLLFSTERDMAVFNRLSKSRDAIALRLQRKGVLQAIHESLAQGSIALSTIDLGPLLHFTYKSKATNQLTAARYEAPYDTPTRQAHLHAHYRHAHYLLHKQDSPAKVVCTHTAEHSLLAWESSKFELYAAFVPSISKRDMATATGALLEWLRRKGPTLLGTPPLAF